MRSASAASTSTSRSSGFGAATPDVSGGPSSISVPNALQPGHLPNQRPAVKPHSAHAYLIAVFATGPGYAALRTLFVPTSCRKSAGELGLRRRRRTAAERGDDEAGEDPRSTRELQRRRRLAEDERGEENRAYRLQGQR